MPDIYEVQAPDGSTLEIQSTGVPTADVAKRAIRAYGDAQAAAAQKKAEAGSTLGSQFTPENVLHDLGTIGSTVGGAVKSLVTEGWKNPLGLNPPERQLTDARINEIAKGGLTGASQQVGADLGRLRTNATQAATGNPLDTLQRAGVTPDMAARAGATTAVAALTPVVLPNAGTLATMARSGVGGGMAATGEGMTTAGEAMNAGTTAAMGGLIGAGLGGGKGTAIGTAIGGATPSLIRGTGRLITATGRAIQPAEVPVPPTPIPAALRPTGTGSPMEPVPPSGTPPWAAPPPRSPMVPPPTGTGTAASPPPSPGAGTEPWTATRPGEPPPIVPSPTGTGNVATPTEGPGPYTGRAPVPEPPASSVPAATGTSNAGAPTETPSWEQFLRTLVRTPGEIPPATEAAAAPAAEETPAAAEPASTAQGALREQLEASLKAQVEQSKPAATETTPAAADTGGNAIVRQQNATAEKMRVESLWQRLMSASSKDVPALADQMSPDDAQVFLDRLDAAPGDNPAVRAAAESKLAAEIESPEGQSTIPSREQMSEDELSRAREGARDSPDRQEGETVEEYRLRTRSRVTGEQSADPSIIPSRRAKAIDDKIDSMYARNATDQEFRDYLAKSANHPNNREIAAKIESKAHSWKRASPLAHVVAGAVATGAALRSALVNQLQGDKKDEQQ